jgi:hypothetical protein
MRNRLYFIIAAALLLSIIFSSCSEKTIDNNTTSSLSEQTQIPENTNVAKEDQTKTPVTTNIVKEEQTEEYNPNLVEVTLKTESTKPEEVANALFEKYLKLFTTEKVSDKMRIAEYKINEIALENGDLNKFTFRVSYAIRPATDKYVLAGNGIQEKNGWIDKRSFFGDVNKVDGEYKLVGLYTGK